MFTTAAHLEDPVMPPNSPRISARELDLISRWIEAGLPEKSGIIEVAKMSAPDVSIGVSSQDARPTESDVRNAARPRSVLQPIPLTILDTHPTKPFAAIGGDRQLVLVDTTSGEFIDAFDLPAGDVTAVRFSQDGKLLLAAAGVAGQSGSVTAFDIETGEKQFEVGDENDSILSFDLSPDGTKIALGGPAKVVRILDVRSGEVLHSLRKHTDWVLTVRYSPDGLLLASGDRFGGLFVWEPVGGEQFHGLRGHSGPVHAVGWDEDNETLVSAGDDGTIRTWNMHHGEQTSHWDAGAGALLCLAIGSGNTIAGGRSGKISRWLGPDTLLSEVSLEHQVESLGISKPGNVLLVGDRRGILRGLDTGTLEQRWTTNLPTDSKAMQQVLTRLGSAETEYSEKLASTDMSADEELNSTVERFALLERSLAQSQAALRELDASMSAAIAALSDLQKARAAFAAEAARQAELLNTLKSEIREMSTLK
jgi:WD40 repeat protein